MRKFLIGILLLFFANTAFAKSFNEVLNDFLYYSSNKAQLNNFYYIGSPKYNVAVIVATNAGKPWTGYQPRYNRYDIKLHDAKQTFLFIKQN